jgi:hypothetical protein
MYGMCMVYIVYKGFRNDIIRPHFKPTRFGSWGQFEVDLGLFGHI